MAGYIYITTNKINNKKYIGKCWNNNNPNYIGSGVLLVKAVKKYGKSNFIKKILESDIKSKEDLIKKEIFYIKKYNAFKSSKFYNLTEGGDGGDIVRDRSIFRTEKHRNKCRDIALIRNKNPEYLKKLSRALKGRVVSQETRLKLKKSHESQTNDNLKKKVNQLNDKGDVISTFNSLTDATKSFNKKAGNSAAISKACKTGIKVWGFYWEYVVNK